MKFTKEKNIYVARGINGTFYIKKSRGYYWPEYRGKLNTFRLQPRALISEAKEQCMENYFWEKEKQEAKFIPIKSKELPFAEKKQCEGEQVKLF